MAVWLCLRRFAALKPTFNRLKKLKATGVPQDQHLQKAWASYVVGSSVEVARKIGATSWCSLSSSSSRSFPATPSGTSELADATRPTWGRKRAPQLRRRPMGGPQDPVAVGNSHGAAKGIDGLLRHRRIDHPGSFHRWR